MLVLEKYKVKSSHIEWVIWTDIGLVIVFKDMSAYKFPDVNHETTLKLAQASSVGGYFNMNIKDKYEYKRLGSLKQGGA